MRAPLATSPLLQQAHGVVRSAVSFLASDRPMAPDIEAAARLVMSGALVAPFADLFTPVLFQSDD
jgi:histidine ammonia-lyase